MSDFIPIRSDALEKIFCPCCDEADMRLQRMKIINEAREMQESGVAAVVQVLGANFYDTLYETLEDPELLIESYSNLMQLYMESEIYGSYLYLCAVYGLMGEVIPEPIQWLATHKPVLCRFVELLLDALSKYLEADGFLDTAPETASPPPDNMAYF